MIFGEQRRHFSLHWSRLNCTFGPLNPLSTRWDEWPRWHCRKWSGCSQQQHLCRDECASEISFDCRNSAMTHIHTSNWQRISKKKNLEKKQMQKLHPRSVKISRGGGHYEQQKHFKLEGKHCLSFSFFSLSSQWEVFLESHCIYKDVSF